MDLTAVINGRYKTLIQKIDLYAKEAVSVSRYEHSVRTAETCVRFAEHYGLDPEKAYVCGIGHDICKKLSSEQMLEKVKLDGRTISEIEAENPDLLHGRAAAVVLERDFGITDEEILQAVANHTFGLPGMGGFAKILFAADKVEPGRPHVDEEYYERLLSLNLNDMTKAVVKESLDYLESKGKKPAPQTLDFYNSLQENY